MSLLLTTPVSLLIWEYMPEFSNLQFPWRWLIFSGFSVSIIAGNLIGNFKGKVQRSAGILFIPLLIISCAMMLQISFFKKGDLDQWRMHPSAFAPFEYRPVWLNDPKAILPAVEKAIIIKGNGSVDIIDWESNKRVLSTKGDTPLTLKFSTFYYPGWKAEIDGLKALILIEKNSGAMLVNIPAGLHMLKLKFIDTPLRYYSKLISLSSCFAIILLLLFPIRPRIHSFLKGIIHE
jgi:hypothetical protein